MAGVEILATEEVAVAWGFSWTAFIVTFIVVAIGGLIASIVTGIQYNSFSFGVFMFVILFIVAGLFGWLAGEMLGEPTEYETHYKVTISDEVSMNEFLERYEIVDQDGKIFTVRERND